MTITEENELQAVEQLRREKLDQRERPISEAAPQRNDAVGIDAIFEQKINRMIEAAKNRTPEQIAYVQEMEERQRMFKVESLRHGWNAPKRAVSLKEPDLTGPWGETLAKLAAKLGTGFLIGVIGGRGPGKTQLGVELMKTHTKNLRSAHYVTATEFFMTVKRAYRDGAAETEIDIIKRFRKPSLLVMDETGKRADTDWENRLLFELIDKRYQDMTDTLLISNEAQAQFVEAIGPSLASRMQETGGIIQCNWPSFRE
jgi:DNA replication protein DnaC